MRCHKCDEDFVILHVSFSWSKLKPIELCRYCLLDRIRRTQQLQSIIWIVLLLVILIGVFMI